MTNIGTYCKDCHYELSHLEDYANDAESSMGYEKMDLESLVFEKINEEFEARKMADERTSFHTHAPKALFGLFEGITSPTIYILLSGTNLFFQVLFLKNDLYLIFLNKFKTNFK